MKALVKAKAEKGLWMQEVPVPEITENDVLIKVKTTAICGTDLHIYLWDEWSQNNVPIPTIVGHEFVGEVVDMGTRVKGFKVGDRVSGEGHLTCGVCRNCRRGQAHLCDKTVGVGYHTDGCFADYMVLPASNVFSVPEDIPSRVAAIFDPLGNAVHTALSFDLVGEDVLITGAGPIGLMSVMIARHAGARHVVITDVNPKRLKLAEEMGAVTRAVNVAETNVKDVIRELKMESGFDVVFEMSGNATAFEQIPSLVTSGARIALLGVLPSKAHINWHAVIFKSLVIKGIYGREIFETWYKMISMLQSGLNVEPVITHEFARDDFQKAFDTMLQGDCGKIILNWD
jgi:threonine 3-dehydrogenase